MVYSNDVIVFLYDIPASKIVCHIYRTKDIIICIPQARKTEFLQKILGVSLIILDWDYNPGQNMKQKFEIEHGVEQEKLNIQVS